MITKREIEYYMAEVIGQCRKNKIPVSHSICPEVKINKRAKSRFACCRKQKHPQKHETIFLIEVSEALMEAEVKIVKGILAHEILHTCSGCYNHGAKWKKYADEMNKDYGYNISTTSTYENLGLKKPQVERQMRYTIVCLKCGAQLKRERKSKLVTHTNSYRCKCGGRLKCKDNTQY